jgi:hypothetical protein
MHNEQLTIRNSRSGDRQSAQLFGQVPVFHRVDVGRATTLGKVAQQMSWAAHELENFWLLKHLGMRVSYLGLLLGALSPDFLTKVYAYGITIAGHTCKADNAAQFHHGSPGMGFTTSIMLPSFSHCSYIS